MPEVELAPVADGAASRLVDRRTLHAWTGVAGLGRLAPAVPMRPADRFRAGSTAKPFFSVVVLHLDIAAAQPPVPAPGTGVFYSNTKDNLLGLIIESTTGRSWRDEVTRRIVRPLRLTRTDLPAPGRHSIERARARLRRARRQDDRSDPGRHDRLSLLRRPRATRRRDADVRPQRGGRTDAAGHPGGASARGDASVTSGRKPFPERGEKTCSSCPAARMS